MIRFPWRLRTDSGKVSFKSGVYRYITYTLSHWNALRDVPITAHPTGAGPEIGVTWHQLRLAIT
ncbi:hypothetical protein ElyMa_005976300, partial [Elysia marginata]